MLKCQQMAHSKLIIGGNQKKQSAVLQEITQKHLNSTWPKPHPDLLVIAPASSSAGGVITIEQIRKLKHKLALKPYLAATKVIIILEAGKLTLPAQNALLKTLEEPPANNLIILCVSHAELLLPTIISRCELIRLNSISQINPEKKEITIHQQLITKILKSGAGERLKLASDWSKGRNEALELVKIQLHILRQSMLHKPTSAAVQNIRSTQKALQMLEANTNPILTLGNLFLSYLLSAPGAFFY